MVKDLTAVTSNGKVLTVSALCYSMGDSWDYSAGFRRASYTAPDLVAVLAPETAEILGRFLAEKIKEYLAEKDQAKPVEDGGPDAAAH
jgi:hypothetical protein